MTATTETNRAAPGRWFTIESAPEEYPVFTSRLLRTLVARREISFSRAGRKIVFSDRDIEDYLAAHRQPASRPR